MRAWAVILAATALKLWLTAARTLEALGGAIHDDWWFLQTARAIMAGRWLGPYNELTLIKGPVYPIFIALTSSLQIPVLFAQQLFYALACLAVSFALPRARLFVFLVLLFNPMTFSDEIATRLTREGFYPALTLFVFAGIAGAVLRRNPRPWVLLAGVSIALFWHTREEGVWILPLLLVAAILNWRRALLIAIIPVLTHIAILLLNGTHYGVYEVAEFKERSFLRAYGSLTRVRQNPVKPRIPVPKEVRERVYAVSPAFAELRPYLEGQLGADWAQTSMPQGRGEIGGAWFMWAFREAVALAGYYKRGGPAVQAYYDRISDEIEAARVSGRLDADPARATMLPPILSGQPRAIVMTFLDGLLRLPTFRDFSVTPRYSESELRAFAETTHTRVAPRGKLISNIHLTGWVVHVDGGVDIRVEGGVARIQRLPSPDLYEHLKARWKDFPPARHARFDITVIPNGDVTLVLSMGGRIVERIPLGPTAPASRNRNIRMSVDAYDVKMTNAQLNAHDSLRLRVLRWIGRIYQFGFPLLLIVGAILYVRRADRLMTFLLLGVIGAIAARVMILSIIDVTSFWVFTGGYQSPSHAFILVAGALSIATASTRSRPPDFAR